MTVSLRRCRPRPVCGPGVGCSPEMLLHSHNTNGRTAARRDHPVGGDPGLSCRAGGGRQHRSLRRRAGRRTSRYPAISSRSTTSVRCSRPSSTRPPLPRSRPARVGVVGRGFGIGLVEVTRGRRGRAPGTRSARFVVLPDVGHGVAARLDRCGDGREVSTIISQNQVVMGATSASV